MDLPCVNKDIITVFISTLALLISFASFYLNLVYKKYSLICALASWRTDEDPEEKINLPNCAM